MKQAISYPGFHPDDRPMGPAPLSSAILKGETLYISGQVAIEPATGAIIGETMAAQTRQVLTNMQALLRAAGMTMADLVKVNIYLTRLEDFAEMNAVYAEMIPAPYPARSTVGIRLNHPDLLVEMDAIAVRG